MRDAMEDSEVRMADRYADVVIIGGGASGLAAAAELRMSSPELSVAVLEKNSEPGRKLRATGSGRCNITNTSAEGYDEIMEFFGRIGLMTRSYENGLVYPYSESAADVVSLLVARVTELGADIITDAEVLSVRRGPDKPRFEVSYKAVRDGRVRDASIGADHVILACGGKAGPSYGTTGDGYRFARELGHSVVTPVPVLTSIECREWSGGFRPDARMLAGTRTRGSVKLIRYGKGGKGTGIKIFDEQGEIQFTRYGLSGICVFNMTRYMRYNRSAGESLSDFVIMADLYPDGDIEDFLRGRREGAFPGEKAADVLRTVLKENIACYVLETASALSGNRHLQDRDVCALTDSEISAAAGAVHSLTFHPESLKGWKDAQATSGGVSTDEINEMTCESEIVTGLYITGELADRDYPCGGFNLSNAWLTGLRAARAVSAEYEG